MHLTFVNDMGQSTEVEIDGQMELENVMALLEVEVRMSSTGRFDELNRLQSGIPTAQQSIHYENRELSDPKKTMVEYGVQDRSMLLLRRKVTVAGR
jgi:DNA damage-inducible protein 1